MRLVSGKILFDLYVEKHFSDYRQIKPINTLHGDDVLFS